MLIQILTLFPEMFRGPFEESITGRAASAGLVEIRVVNLRDYTTDKHHQVDDYPYGGGRGMVMKPEPLFRAVEELSRARSRNWGTVDNPGDNSGKKSGSNLGDTPGNNPGKNPGGNPKDNPGDKFGDNPVVILLSPQGVPFNQKKAAELAACRHLILICGHYEGIDQRVVEHLVDEEISIGDYILTGGELPAMVLTDAVVRLQPGVLSAEALQEESFEEGLLEYPHYTRPSDFRGMQVPAVLLSGNHAQIKKWRRERSLHNTAGKRPDLLSEAVLTEDDMDYLKTIK